MTAGIIGNIARKALVIFGIGAIVLGLRLFVFVDGKDDAAPAPSAGSGSAELLAAVKSVVPGAIALRPGQGGLLEVTDDDDDVLAHVFDTSEMKETLIGYAGRVPVAIVFSPDGKTTAVRPLSNQETPSYIDHVTDRGLFNSFNGMTPEQALAAPVDTVSGATMTSEAVISSVKSGMAALRGVKFGHQAPPHGEVLARLGAIVVLLAGLAFALFPRKLRKFRVPLLIADVVVLGIIGGTTLSLALFASWVMNGPNLPRGVVPFLAFLIAAAVPLVTGRQAWCNCMCPFGAASELAAKIPVKKLCLGTTARKIAGFVGLIYLSTILGLLVVWPTLDLASFEPFAAFSLAAAPVASIVIFAVFFVVSLACPRFWCRFLCPTGRILDAFVWAGRKSVRTAADGGDATDGNCRQGSDL